MRRTPGKLTGTVLATIAMLFQLALSFGHLHVHDLTGHRSVDGLAVSAPADSSHPAGTPDDENHCAICLTMHMVASGALPAPPAFDQPADFSRTAPVARVHFDVVARRHVSFQTRAPPRV
jgi:hypothetical protein